MVLRGLEADASQQPQRALGSYEEALRVDPTNPYAYLAIARHHAEGDDPEWALSFLDQAEVLLRSEGRFYSRVEPHLIGLRGQVLYGSGQVDAGLPHLQRAWELAPDVWTDGQLSASELQ
jgi:tetratricopeptide (TPR) repeat protein